MNERVVRSSKPKEIYRRPRPRTAPRGRALASILIAALGLGCVEQLPLDTQPFVSGLLVVEPPGDAYSLHAVEGPELPSVQVEPGTRLTLLGYPFSLSEMGLVPGPIEQDAGVGRPVPSETSIHRLVAPSQAWVPLEATEFSEADRSRLILPSLRECGGSEACRVFHRGQTVCQKPCIRSKLEDPIGPAAPTAPSTRHCPRARMMDGDCIPPSDRSCPVGTMRLFEGEDCAPLVECPSGDFRDHPGTSAPLRFVRLGAVSGGDGSAEAPYGSVVDALAAEPDAPLVLSLAAGSYAVPAELPSGLTLFGACPEQVELTSLVRVAEGKSLRLEGLRASASVEAHGTLHARGVDFRGERQALAVEARARVTLERAVLAAPSYGLVTRADSTARLVARDIRVESEVGMELSGTSSVSLERVQIVADTRAVGIYSGAELDWTWGHVLSPGTAPMILGLLDARLRARGVFFEAPYAAHFEGWAQATLAGLMQREAVTGVSCAGAAEVSVEDLVQTATTAARGLVVEGSCGLELRRGHATGGGEVFAHVAGAGALDLRDTEVAGFGVGVRAWGESTLQMTRVASPPVETGATDSGAYPDLGFTPGYCTHPDAPSVSDGVQAHLSDVLIRAGPEDAGLSVCANVHVVGTRLRVSGGTTGVSVSGRKAGLNPVDRARAELSDLEVVSVPETRFGIFARASDLEVRGFRNERARLYGMYLVSVQAKLSQIQIGATAPRLVPIAGDSRLTYCTSEAYVGRSPASGIFVEGLIDQHTPITGVPSVVSLSSFRLHDSICAGFGVGASTTFTLGRGVLEGNYIGLSLLRFTEGVVAPDVYFLGSEHGSIYDLGGSL